MGFFKSIHDVTKQAKEIDKNWDVKAQNKDALSRMANAQAAMAEQTRAANLSLSGRDATVSVVSATPTNAQVNFNPILQLEVTVFPEAGPPYPVTLRQMVSQLYLAKVQPGSTLRAKVDPSDRESVWLDLVNS